MEEVFDEAGEDGRDHAESEHVQADREEDEGGGGAACRGRSGGEGGRDKFRLCEERVGGGGCLFRVLWMIGHTIER